MQNIDPSSEISPSFVDQFTRDRLRKLRKIMGLSIEAPYMKQREIDIIIEILMNLQPQNCLEYGSGYSTLFFPTFLPPTGRWMALEHHREWFERVLDMNSRANVTVRHATWSEHEKDQIGYVQEPTDKAPFDFILVDGVARQACIREAFDMLSEDGLLIVHDANRSQYHQPLTKFKYRLVLEDFRRTAGGLAFASNSRPIGTYFQLRDHARLWKLQSNVTNIMRFKFLPWRTLKSFRLFSPSNTKTS